MKRFSYKRLSEKEYKQLKQLTDINISNAKLGRLMKRSGATIGYIRNSKSYQDYKDKVSKVVETARIKKDNKKLFSQNIGGDGRDGEPNLTQTELDLSHIYTTQTELLLERIATVLEKLEEHWRPSTEKKTFKLFR